MADTSLYARLQKLFSTNVIVRNVGGKKLKVADTDSIQGFVSNAMRDRYLRLHAASAYGQGGHMQYNLNATYQAQRLMFFRDYDIMDMDPILSSALDIYMEESTIKNEFGKVLTIHSENSQINEILNNLFYDILNIEYNLPWWIRNMAKYGDMFLFLEISPEYGIHNVLPLSVYDTFRYEGLNPQNPYEVFFETLGIGGQKRKLQNYEVAHFRMLTDGNFLPYGKSMLESARRVWRQLQLMEDAMLIHRIMRAPEKRIFKIDIGNIAPSEVDKHITNLINKTKKIPFIDERTGDYNLNYNMQNLLEDFYIPVRGSDSGTDIQNLGGLEYQAIDDIEYLRNKLMAALRIPKAFFGYEEALSGKTTLAAEDVRFARTIERIQRIVVSELTKIAIVHLYAQGFTDEQLINFTLDFASPSTIYEQEKLNLWREKIGLAADITNSKLLSTDWIYENILHLSPEQYQEERSRVVQDVKRTFRLTTIEQGQSDPAKFGYPQDKEQPTPEDPSQMPGGSPDQAPSGGPPGGAQQSPVGETTNMPGRPKEAPHYGKDSHVRGRDPLGAHGRTMLNSENPTNRRKSPLSIENLSHMKRSMDKILKRDGGAKLLGENNQSSSQDTTENTYLDEDNLLDENFENKK